MNVENSENPYENLDLWWAYVIHSYDSLNEYAQVNQFVDWKPKRPDDFQRNFKYSLRTKMWREDGKYDRCKVFILAVAETLEEVDDIVKKKRLPVPRIESRDSDYTSDLPDNDGTLKRGKESVGHKRSRSMVADLAAKRSKAEDKDMEKFAIKMDNLLASVPSSSSSSPGTKPLNSKPKPSSQGHSSATKSQSSLAKPTTLPSFVKSSLPTRPSLHTKPKHETSSVKSLSPMPSSQNTKMSGTSTVKSLSPMPSSQNTKTYGTSSVKSLSSMPSSSSKLFFPDRKILNISSKGGTFPNGHSTELQTHELCSNNQSGDRSAGNRVVEQVIQSSFKPSSSPSEATQRIYSEEEMQLKENELQSLRQQLQSAHDQLAKKDDVILGELRSLSHRVASIEEGMTSKLNPDYGKSVQWWLDNQCHYSQNENNSSHSSDIFH